MKKGKFIALYGINGIGKSTQAHHVVAALQSQGYDVEYVKYPIYDLEPEGPFLNNYLRDEEFRATHPQTTHELQEKFMRNRERYESIIQKTLDAGMWIVAEDYVGTGIAWGCTWGGSYEYLANINKDLLVPDMEILMDGEQFSTAIEAGHRNEDNKERVAICRSVLQMLAQCKGWDTVDAAQSQTEVTSDLMKMIDHI